MSANDAEAADQPYVKALSNFLQINYEKIIPDIPDIIRSAFSNDAIIDLPNTLLLVKLLILF